LHILGILSLEAFRYFGLRRFNSKVEGRSAAEIGVGERKTGNEVSARENYLPNEITVRLLVPCPGQDNTSKEV